MQNDYVCALTVDIDSSARTQNDHVCALTVERLRACASNNKGLDFVCGIRARARGGTQAKAGAYATLSRAREH